MNALEQAVADAFASKGDSQKANKAYLEFIKANFIIPVDVQSDDAHPEVLFLNENDQMFLPVFSNDAFLHSWSESIKDKIKVLKLSGVDLLKGVGEQVTVCLNIGSEHYKEFNPSEIARMRSIVLKLFSKQ